MPLPERSLIQRIRQLSGTFRSAQVALGIGDDAAILRLPKGREMLVTTDFSLEGVHFRRDWHPPESVGHRCLARGLSDIAAMGGDPVAAFLSLALPPKLPQKWVDGFLRGLLALAGKSGVVLGGGDLAQSPKGILADVVVVGSVPVGQAIRRSGARPGDGIYVTGELGGSAGILETLYANPKRRLNPAKHPRHFYPEPRLAVAKYLRRRGIASAMIDVSDGLSTDLHHLCEASGVGAKISAQVIPLAAGVTLQQALHGGEDYELLFTAPASRLANRKIGKIAGIPVTCIGEIVRGNKLSILNLSGGTILRPEGWEHFTSTR